MSTGPIGIAVAEGTLPGRVWMYANYHCNIECTYCLTESGPKVPRRELGREAMLDVARQARHADPRLGRGAQAPAPVQRRVLGLGAFICETVDGAGAEPIAPLDRDAVLSVDDALAHEPPLEDFQERRPVAPAGR